MMTMTKRAQSGAALIVGLILLMVMTGPRHHGHEPRNSRHAHGRQHAPGTGRIRGGAVGDRHGDAVPEPDRLRRRGHPGTEVRRLDPEYAWPVDVEEPLATASAVTVFRSEADLAPGSGWEAGTMAALHFEVDSDGRSVARSARSQQVAGFYVMAPK
jgi:hypothetical protein